MFSTPLHELVWVGSDKSDSVHERIRKSENCLLIMQK